MALRPDIETEIGSLLDSEAAKAREVRGWGQIVDWLPGGYRVTLFNVEGLSHTFAERSGRPTDPDEIADKFLHEPIAEIKRRRGRTPSEKLR